MKGLFSTFLTMVCLTVVPSGASAAEPPQACTSESLEGLMADGFVANVMNLCNALTEVLGNHVVDDRFAKQLQPLLGLCTAQSSLKAVCKLKADEQKQLVGRFAATVERVREDHRYLRNVCKRTPDATVKTHPKTVELSKSCPSNRAARPALPSAEAFAASRQEFPRRTETPELRRVGLDELAPGIPVAWTVKGAAGSAAAAGGLPTEGSLLDVVVGGLAKFLVARARAELQQFVMKRLDKGLCATGKKAAPYIPKLCAFLDDQSSNLKLGSSFGVAFRAAAIDDLMNLPFVVLKTLAGIDEPALKARLVIGLVKTIVETRSLSRVSLALEDIAAQWACGAAQNCKTFKQTVGRAALFLRALTEVQTKKAVTEQDVQRATLFIAAALSKPLTSRQKFMIRDLVHSAFRVAQLAKRLSRGEAKPQAALKDAIQLAIELLEVAKRAFALAGKPLRIPDDTVGLLKAIGSRDFAQILVRGLALVRELAPKVAAKVPDGVRKVLTLGVELAAAQNADDAAQAFDAFAAPIGSWQVKNQRDGVALNGFVGLSGGAEWIAGGPRLDGGGLSGSAALTGAVGIDFFASDGWGHWSFFLSVIDLGGFLNFRSDTDADTAPGDGVSSQKVAVSSTASEQALQLLSPGLFISHSMGSDVPVNFGIGANYVPHGRIITVDGQSQTAANVKVFAFIAVDITILPFD